MNFLPFENIVFETELDRTEVIERISQTIEPQKTFRFGSKSNKTYEGSVKENQFHINRIISYRNSFLPQIIGEIHEVDGKTMIMIKMRLHLFVSIFFCIWCAIVGFVFIAFIVVSASNGEVLPAMYFPLVLLLFAYVLTTGGFKFESNRSIKDLQTICKASIAG